MSLTRLASAFAVAVFVVTALPARATQLRSGFAADAVKRADLRDLGRLRASAPVSIALSLAYRHQSELEALVALQADARSPLYHRYLTSAQFDAYFAPSVDAYARAIAALRKAGFRIGGTYANRTVLDAVAPAAVAERYFGTELHAVMQAGVGVRYANVRPATLPADLRGIVGSVSGLSDAIVAKPSLAFPDAAGRAAQQRLARVAGPRTQRLPRFDLSRVPHGRSRASVVPGATNVVADPGFESGGFAYWGQCGSVDASIASNRAHTGRYSERAGSTSASSGEIAGDAGLCQQITVPPNAKLRYDAFQFSNESSTQYAYQWVLLLDANGTIVAQLAKTVGNARSWVLENVDLSAYAGRTLFLYFGVHGDGYAGGYTIQYVDDVSVTGGTASPTPTPAPTHVPTPTPTSTPTRPPTPPPTAPPTAPPTGSAPIGGPLRGPDAGFGPVAVADGFDLPVQHGFNGTGRATGVAISGDFADADLATYLNYFGIKRVGPATTRVAVDGGAPYSPALTTTNASFEATLDVETIVGLTPGTHLYMYLFPDLSSVHIEDGYNRAVSDGAIDVLNSSFGGCERDDTAFDTATNQIALQGAAKGITFVASSGDAGSAECGGTGVSAPASGPEFVGVGGTSLTVTATGSYVSESAWSGSGGGISSVFAEPSYQTGIAGAGTAGRNVPDVAFPGDPNTGTAIYFGTGGSPNWDGPLGGTSWASPIYAALQTQIDQRQGTRDGFVNARLYAAFKNGGYGAFHDITSGSNGAFSARSGFDDVTGIGSPKGYTLSGTL